MMILPVGIQRKIEFGQHRHADIFTHAEEGMTFQPLAPGSMWKVTGSETGFL